jgi:hypothetical protein
MPPGRKWLAKLVLLFASFKYETYAYLWLIITFEVLLFAFFCTEWLSFAAVSQLESLTGSVTVQL